MGIAVVAGDGFLRIAVVASRVLTTAAIVSPCFFRGARISVEAMKIFKWLFVIVSIANLRSATFVVTQSASDGPGSLRDAIEQANAAPGADTIGFAIGTQIDLTTALPRITNNLTIQAAPGNPVTISGGGKEPIFSFGREQPAT